MKIKRGLRRLRDLSRMNSPSLLHRRDIRWPEGWSRVGEYGGRCVGLAPLQVLSTTVANNLQSGRLCVRFDCVSLWESNTFVAWLSGNALVSINVVSYSTPGPVSTWIGDRLWAGKPSRYVTSHLGQLSLPSLRGR